MEGCGRRRPSTGDRRGPTTTMTMTHIAAAFGAAVFVATAPAIGFAQLIVKPAPTAKVDRAGRQNPSNLLSATRHRPRLKRPGGHRRCRMRCRIIRHPCVTTRRKTPASQDWGAFRCDRGREHSARHRNQDEGGPAVRRPVHSEPGQEFASNAVLRWAVVVGPDQRQDIEFPGAARLAVVTERTLTEASVDQRRRKVPGITRAIDQDKKSLSPV